MFRLAHDGKGLKIRMSSPLRCYLSCIFSQFTREKTSDAFELACRFLLCGFDEKLQAGRLFAISVRSESTHTYKQRHPVPGHRSCVEVSAFPHCLVNAYQRYQLLRSRLCKMGLHGLYLDVIIGVGHARRPRRNLAFKCSESMAITAERPLR
jgi:hypothetical protein